MDKRIFTMIFVVFLGVVVGVSIVVKQNDKSKFNTMLESQGRIEKNFVNGQLGGSQNSRTSSQINDILRKQNVLEERLSALEGQWGGIKKLMEGAAKGDAGRAAQAPPQEDFNTAHDIAVAHSPVIGAKDAPVTIVEFADFQCPFCARFHPPVNEVLKAFPGKVNYILKNFPLSFHPQARPAAKAAFAAAEQGKYSEMLEALLENGRDLSEEKFKVLAEEIGLDVEKFMKDYTEKDAQWEEYIQKDMALASKVGVRGTPTFYINGRKTRARDFESFKREINQILENKD